MHADRRGFLKRKGKIRVHPRPKPYKVKYEQIMGAAGGGIWYSYLNFGDNNGTFSQLSSDPPISGTHDAQSIADLARQWRIGGLLCGAW